jgi:hypothetical protein
VKDAAIPTAWAPVSPRRFFNCALTSPRAASSPKTNPAIAMAITISGPSENTA